MTKLSMRIVMGIVFFLALAGLSFFAGNEWLTDQIVPQGMTMVKADQNLQSSPEQIYDQTFQQMPVRLRFAGGVLLIFASTLVVFHGRIFRFLAQFSQDSRIATWQIGRGFRSIQRSDRLILALIIFVGIFLRANYLSQPIRIDEAATYTEFAARPLYIGLAYYPVPNNHLFHTLLVHFVTKLGSEPPFLRIPALTAGILIIPTSYALGCLLFSNRVGILGASLVASSSYLIEYSTLARGYTIQTLLFVCALLCAALLTKKDNKFIWTLFVICWVLGFYTVPTTVYGFGIILIWMFLQNLFLPSQVLWQVRLRQLMIVSIVIAYATILLYLPVIILSGPEAIVGNRFVSGLSWSQFTQAIGPSLISTWQLWCRDVSLVFVIILNIGFLISLVPSNQHREFFPIPLVVVVWCLPVLMLQRVVPFERVWIFLIPLFLIYSAAGIGILMRYLHVSEPLARAGAVMFCIVLGLAVNNSPSILTSPQEGRGVVSAEPIVLFLKENLSDGDRLFQPNQTIVYYMSIHNVPESIIVFDTSKMTSRLWYVLPDSDQIKRNFGAYLDDQFPQFVNRTLVKQFTDASLYLLTR